MCNGGPGLHRLRTGARRENCASNAAEAWCGVWHCASDSGTVAVLFDAAHSVEANVS